MAFRTWARLLAVTLGVGALAGASQLGVAYGLGVLRLTRVLDTTTRDQWTAQLAWVAWFAMMSAVIGALAGGAFRDRLRGPTTVGTNLGLAVAAGVGAAIVVPLTMQPARTAQIAGVHPVFVIGVCAGLGALVGVFAGYAALAQTVARWNLSAMGAAVWVLAITSVTPSLAPSDPLPAVRLGVFDAGFLSPAVTQRTALFTMPALALLIGAGLGWRARRRELPTLTIALAGLAGPALLTMAYLIAGPGSGSDRYQVVPYWAAMTATGAGVLGSVLAAVLRRGPEPDDAADDAAEKPAGADGTARPAVLRPTDTPVFDPPRSAGDAHVPGQRPAPGSAGSPPPAPPSPGSPSGTAADDAAKDSPAPGSLGPSAGVARGGRRSSAADAFTTRSGEWPLRRSGPAADPGSGPPRGGSVTLGDSSGPEPFDAFARGAENAGRAAENTGRGAENAGRGGGSTPWSGSRNDAPAAMTYVPAPATTPLPPEAIQEPPATRTGGGLLSRGRRPFGRGRNRAGKDQPPTHDQPGRTTGPGPDQAATTDRPGATPAGGTPGTNPFSGTPGAGPFGGTPGAGPFGGTAGGPAAGGAPAPRPPHGRDLPDVPGMALRPDPPSATRHPGVPAPAHRPDVPPPAAIPEPAKRRRGRPRPETAGTPLVPEPQAVSAPLPRPDPITPPLSVTPVPESERRGKKRGSDDDYVDWVSGLGQ